MASLTLGACGGAGGARLGSIAAIQLVIQPSPVKVGHAALTLTISDSSAQPVTGAVVDMEGDMSHPGMAPVFASSKEIAPGRYAADMNFPMAGDWIILLHMKLANGTKVERQVEVKDVRAN